MHKTPSKDSEPQGIILELGKILTKMLTFRSVNTNIA